MTVENPGYETKAADPAPAGRALGWTAAVLSSVYDWADFGVNVPTGYEGEPTDTFELGWPDDTQLVAALPSEELGLLAIFNVSDPVPRLYENFESAWELQALLLAGVRQWMDTLTSLGWALFGALYTYETFWWADVPLDFESSDLEWADFGTAGTTETFESDWENNPVYPEWAATWSVVADPSWGDDYMWFGAGSGVAQVETFEAVATRYQVMDVDISAGNLYISDASEFMSVPVDVEFSYSVGIPTDGDYSPDLPQLPSPLRYRHTYWAVEANTSNPDYVRVAVGPTGTKIVPTTKGGGAFYLSRSRMYYWITRLQE